MKVKSSVVYIDEKHISQGWRERECGFVPYLCDIGTKPHSELREDSDYGKNNFSSSRNNH